MRASIACSLFVLAILGASFLSLALPLRAQQSVTPMSHPRIRGSTDSESTNWSGYAVTGAAGSVTNVEGSWTMPTATCSSTSSYAAFWVGIDGYTSSTVEQTGTMAECARGTASYYAWYEFYPNPSYEITSVTISPGDVISASVVYSGGSFTTTITDTTTGKSYSTSATVSAAQESSAEWITEAPSSGNSILPLANFGTVYCGSDYTSVPSTDYATVSGTAGQIGSFGSSVQEITMVSSSGSTEAQPSALTTDGTSFSVAWGSGSTTTTTTSTTSTSTTSTTTTSTTPSLVVVVSTNKQSYTVGSEVMITVAVTSSTGPAVSGASVTVTVTTPNGGAASGTGRTNSRGDITFLYLLSKNAPHGVYTISATASASGYSSGSGSTTFTVT